MILSAERRRALTHKAERFAGSLDLAMPYLLTRAISREAAEMFGLGYVEEGEFADRVSIPYFTPAGVVGIKYRSTKDEHPKYYSETGTGIHLYNAQALIRADRCVLTEGELDAMCVQAYCGIPAVAYPGVDTWGKQRHYRLCFEGLSEVIVIADGDNVGRQTARAVAESIGIHARVVDLGDGLDANSFLALHGAGAFQERLSK